MARASELAVAVRGSRRELWIAGVVVTWIAAGVWLDSHASIWPQRALGIVTWIVLLLILRGERRDVRAQVAIVIVVATAVEYTASGWLGVYTYRLHNIPLVRAARARPPVPDRALRSAARSCSPCWRRPVIGATIAIGGAWAIWGLAFAPRNDAFGAIVYLCLLRFLLVGRAPLVYAGAFMICSYLELMGTSVGTWAWAPHDASGLLGVGNPPSGIPGAYCFFDAAALAGFAGLLSLVDGLGARLRALPLRVRLALR